MAPLSKNMKIVLAGVSVIVLGVLGYWFMNRAPAEDVSSENGLSSQSAQNTSQVGKKLMATLDTIRTIKLDRSIVESSTFMSLQDFSTEISPLPVGRDNPFAPIRPNSPSGTVRR